jgi:hypothetical protein
MSLSEQENEKLENKMREIFEEEMKKLSEDMQDVLIDDIVTTFLNRINLFIKIEAKKKRYTHTKLSLDT